MSAVDLSALDPASTALLVIDMQNAFVHPEGTLGLSGVDLSEAPGATANVAALVAAAEAAGSPVIWTRQVHLEPDRGREAKRIAAHTSKRVRVAALDGTWDAALIDEFAAYGDSIDVLDKHRFSAFYGTRLEPMLRMRGVRALVIVGSTANACVDTTIREAYLRDLDVVVALDGVIAVNAEWKAVAAQIWSQYFGVVTDSATVLAWLRQTGGER